MSSEPWRKRVAIALWVGLLPLAGAGCGELVVVGRELGESERELSSEVDASVPADDAAVEGALPAEREEDEVDDDQDSGGDDDEDSDGDEDEEDEDDDDNR